MSTTRLILLTSIIVLSLAFFWKQLTFKPSTPPVSATQLSRQQMGFQSINTLSNRIESLENELANEQSMRLEFELRLTALEQQAPFTNEVIKQSDIKHEKESDLPVKTPIKPPTLQDKLLSALIPLDTIQRIQQQVGKNRLARLELRDKAIREDWIDTPEYIEKEQLLPRPTSGLRDQFGDQVFDQYLYASGRPNRVIVREVFSGSAAEDAGIKPNDIIITYASEVIFTMNNLQQATTEGIGGEPVLIEIQREELPFTTSVPRGPLGISMTIMRKQPE